MDTTDPAYADRLVAEQGRWWKRLLPVQAPYVFNLRRQRLGRTLDVGCGIGRNLRHLPPGSVGVDHNAEVVGIARRAGLQALTVDQMKQTAAGWKEGFDALLVAHVLEHMTETEASALLTAYLAYLRPGGTIFVICPQERGFASDPTHVWFADAKALETLLASLGLRHIRSYSFPLPRRFGTRFKYNEFCVRAST